MVRIDETIFLDSDNDEESQKCGAKQIAAKNNEQDLGSILKSFENIQLAEKPKHKQPEKLDETHLPLSMRMKKKFGITPSTIFNN